MIPIIRIEIEGIRERLTQMFADRSDNINEMVAKSLEKVLSEENIQDFIDKEVQKAVYGAISSLSENYTIRSIMIGIVSTALESYRRSAEGIKWNAET